MAKEQPDLELAALRVQLRELGQDNLRERRIILTDLRRQRAAEAQAERARKRLAVHNAQLARRVAERTSRLEQANAELARANEEMESFAYSISHDLRAPLRSINGFSRILVEEYANELSPEATRYLKIIEASATEMGELIDDILALSRLGTRAVQSEPVNTRQLVDEVIEALAPEMAGRDVVFEVGELSPCTGDANLLRQVFVNLLSNAVKFSRGRTPARISVASHRSGEEVTYSIQDNGVGFDMRYSDKLFKVFQRLHAAQDFEGTGVGLVIVERIIKRHGGRVWSVGEVDRGATFFFTLPEAHDG